jgi:hypothetical protein
MLQKRTPKLSPRSTAGGVPGKAQLESLVDTSCGAPTINQTVFPATSAGEYWTKDNHPTFTGRSWLVDFSSGGALAGFNPSMVNVRLVRSGQPFASLAQLVILFGTAPTLTVGGGTGSVTASNTVAAANHPAITFTSTTPLICTVTSAGVVTAVAAGTCTIAANQLGLADVYAQAVQVTQSFTISPAPLGNSTRGGAPFSGTTVPLTGAGAPASASFTTTNNASSDCRFDPVATQFTASPAAAITEATSNRSTLPHGAFAFKIIGCDPGFSATWPSLAGLTINKYGKASVGAISDSLYTLAGMSTSGNTITYTLTDGQLGDNDGVRDGVIIDPVIPVMLAPGIGTETVPTLNEWMLALLAFLMLGVAGVASRGRGRL